MSYILRTTLSRASGIERETSLMQQAVGTRAARLAGRVKPHTRFAHPYEETPDPGGKGHGRMRYAGARLQHETSQAADRDMCAYPFAIDNDECTVENIDLASLDKQDRGAVGNRDGPRRRQAGHCSRGSQLLRADE